MEPLKTSVLSAGRRSIYVTYSNDNMRQNLNDMSHKELPEYEGKQILVVLHKVIGDDFEGYQCIMQGGDKQVVPAEVIDNAPDKQEGTEV